MSCKCAKRTDEYHGWACTVTDGECMFLFPDSKACAEIYGEGPDTQPAPQGSAGRRFKMKIEETIHCEKLAIELFKAYDPKCPLIENSKGIIAALEKQIPKEPCEYCNGEKDIPLETKLLKPCPFCGGKAVFDDCDDGSGCIKCSMCDFTPLVHASWGRFRNKSKQQAIDEWNRRPE